MSKRALPKIGDKIPANKFFVSKMNARVNEAFGETDEDQALIGHLTWRDIVQPFKARPEGEGYGVVVGRRRFLAKMKSKAKEFIVGKDCFIEEMTDEEALDASIRENLTMFKSDMNPMVRARALASLLDMRGAGIRSLARLWRIPASTLTEWLTVLELNPKMQEVTEKARIYYTDALRLARMKLGSDLQDKLAEIAETGGIDAFRKEIERLQAGRGKRGIPAGKYIILRTVFDKRYRPDVQLYQALTELAEAKEQKVDEYVKWVLSEHIKSAT